MKFIFIILAVIFAIPNATSQNVTIVESQTGDDWSDQDTHWEDIAISMGLNAEIVPQNFLESSANLESTDALIISSGTIALPPANYETLLDYVMNGGAAYVQSEYQVSYEGSITFDSLMRDLNIDFAWTNTISGQLTPMNIFGTLSETPNNVATLEFFNFGLAGSGTGVEPFLEFEGNNFGFCYVDPELVNGTLITISDEDWAWNDASPELMENILAKLLQLSLGASDLDGLKIDVGVYPNPSEGNITIDLGKRYRTSSVLVRDVSGKIIFENEYRNDQIIEVKLDAPAGVYFTLIKTEYGEVVERLVLN